MPNYPESRRKPKRFVLEDGKLEVRKTRRNHARWNLTSTPEIHVLLRECSLLHRRVLLLEGEDPEVAKTLGNMINTLELALKHLHHSLKDKAKALGPLKQLNRATQDRESCRRKQAQQRKLKSRGTASPQPSKRWAWPAQ